MNRESFKTANLRSAGPESFKIDPLAFTEERRSSNQSRPSSAEAANQQLPVAADVQNAVDSSEVNTFANNGVIFEKPYQTPALEMGAR